MRIRKSKPLEVSQVSVHRSRPPILNKDNGIMAVPIPADNVQMPIKK
jgi:hypothetical protein